MSNVIKTTNYFALLEDIDEMSDDNHESSVREYENSVMDHLRFPAGSCWADIVDADDTS